MSVYPQPSIDDKEVSKFVIVYDEDLQDCDLGWFDFKTKEWNVIGGFSMKLKCWCEIPKPSNKEVFNYHVSLHRGYRE